MAVVFPITLRRELGLRNIGSNKKAEKVNRFPWEIFLEKAISKKNILVLLTGAPNNSFFIGGSSRSVLIWQLLLKAKLTHIYAYLDSSCYKSYGDLVYQTSYSCLYINSNITFITSTADRSIFSISNIFLASQWVERELREFFDISIVNLTDTRRLLTDYTFGDTAKFNGYKTTSYDLVVQDLYF